MRVALGTLSLLLFLGGCGIRGPQPKPEQTTKVIKDSVITEVLETGAIEANQVVEIKSRVAGRVDKLYVEEGDLVEQGALIAIVDPQETRLQVDQNRAQLEGARANVARLDVEIAQRRVTASVALEQAKIRLMQIEKEAATQPQLSNSSIRAAQANLASAEERRKQLVQATHPNERTVLESEVQQARATLANAQLELKRLEALLTKEYVAGQAVDQQKLQVDLAQSRLNASEERLRRLRLQHEAEIKSADETIKAQRADLLRANANASQDINKQRDVMNAREAVRQAQAQLKDVDALIASRRQGVATADQIRSVLSDSERQLRETEIRAPRAGIITKKLIQEGELVSSLSSFSSGTPIVRLEDRSSLLVKLNVNEIDTAKLKLGMPASITVDAMPLKTFAGRITKISPARVAAQAGSQDAVVRYEVEVKLDSPSEEIKSGMTAKVKVEVTKRDNVLTVPIDYLIKEGDKRFVQVKAAKTGEKPQKVEVKLGTESQGKAEILSGVAEGTELVRPPFDGPDRRGFGPSSE